MFSPNSQWLATGSGDATVRLWDMQKRTCIHTFLGHSTSWINAVAFSSDGQWLAVGNGDSTIQIWDMQQRKCIHTFTGHAHWVHSVAFSPDDQWLATSGDDAIIQLWDIQQWQCAHTFIGHTDEVHSIAFSADSHQLATGSSDATVRLWDVETGTCLAVLPLPGLYEGTNIHGAQGLTNAQRNMMLALGAIDRASKNQKKTEIRFNLTILSQVARLNLSRKIYHTISLDYRRSSRRPPVYLLIKQQQ